MADVRKSVLCDSILREGSTILSEKSKAVEDVKNLGDKDLAVLSQLYVECIKERKCNLYLLYNLAHLVEYVLYVMKEELLYL